MVTDAKNKNRNHVTRPERDKKNSNSLPVGRQQDLRGRPMVLVHHSEILVLILDYKLFETMDQLLRNFSKNPCIEKKEGKLT